MSDKQMTVGELIDSLKLLPEDSELRLEAFLNSNDNSALFPVGECKIQYLTMRNRISYIGIDASPILDKEFLSKHFNKHTVT